MQCPNCEAENRDEAKFCDECGFPLSGSIARVAGAASPTGVSARETRRASTRQRKPVDEPVFEDPYVSEFEPEPADRDAYYVEPIGAADVVEAPSNSNGFQPISDERGFAAADEPDDLPMSDTDYESGAWGYDQSRTQSFEPQREEDYSRGADAEKSSFDVGQPEWTGDFTMEMPRVEQDRPAQGRDFRVAPSRTRMSKGKLVAFVVAGIAVGAIIAAVVTFALGLWGGVAVPNVTGMTEADARNVLTDNGFTVRTTQVKSDDTEGLVLIMDPGAGSRAPEGSEVVIHIATARFVPDIVGKNADEAKVLLEGAGYENVRYEMQKSDGDENVVLEVTPEQGTRAKSNAEVVVKVSEAYRVPNVSGLGLDAAMDAISDSGLYPEVVYIDTDQFLDGSIIGVNPEAGTKVGKGSTVSISVARARGIELVGLTESMFSKGNTVTIGGVDYEIESVISVSYEGDNTVAFTVTGRPKITFFGETLYASSSQTIAGQITWSDDNEVVSIS